MDCLYWFGVGVWVGGAVVLGAVIWAVYKEDRRDRS